MSKNILKKSEKIVVFVMLIISILILVFLLLATDLTIRWRLYGYGLVFCISVADCVYIRSINKKRTKEKLDNDKTKTYNGAADYFKGMIVARGSLHLNDEELFFKSGVTFNKIRDLHIPINNITKVKKSNRLFFIPFGIVIIKNDGCKVKFLVDEREIWIRKISKAIVKPVFGENY